MVIEGPLAPWALGIAEHLKALGYARLTTGRQMELAGRLSRFLQRRGLGTRQLTEEVIEEFLRAVRPKGGPSRRTPKALAWLVAYLRDIAVMPAPVPPRPQSGAEELVDRYRRYLVDERGLVPETVVESCGRRRCSWRSTRAASSTILMPATSAGS